MASANVRGAKKATTHPSAGKDGSVDVQLAQIAAELRSKPGIFSTIAILLGAMALPGAILIAWFNSEMTEIKEAVAASAAAATQAATNSAAVVDQIDSLVLAMARSVATPVDNPAKLFAINRIFPQDLVAALDRPPVGLSYIKHAAFSDTQWIFMSTEDFNLLDSSTQAKLRTSIEALQASTEDLSIRLELTFDE